MKPKPTVTAETPSGAMAKLSIARRAADSGLRPLGTRRRFAPVPSGGRRARAGPVGRDSAKARGTPIASAMAVAMAAALRECSRASTTVIPPAAPLPGVARRR